MDYVLFGIQGSGKGTQSEFLKTRVSAAYFETGGELRKIAAENSPLGQKVKSIIEAGHLVPTEVVMDIVDRFLTTQAHDPKSSVIFDGLPRNREQNKLFEALLRRSGRSYKGIYFSLSREEAETRLLTRRICKNKNCKTVYPASYKQDTCAKCGGELVTRADDNTSGIKTRLDTFFKETLPIIEDWESRGLIVTVNAAGTIEEVKQELFAKLDLD